MKTHALLDNQLTEALFWLVACYSCARCLVCGEGRPCPACWVSTEATPCWGAATGTIPAQAMACSLPSGLTARLPGVTWAWQVVLVDCGGGGQGRVPTGDCASVPAARARPAVEAAAGTEAATTATTRHHQGRTSSSSYTGDTTCTHHHQPHEPAPSSTGSRGHHPPPPTTSNHGLQLYSQHGEAAPLRTMLFLVTAKTFDQVYIPLLNIPLH